MTRSEAYAEGFQEGRRLAEWDIANGTQLTYRDGWLQHFSDPVRAREIGTIRGYRDTFARYEAGTLTRSQFELAPLSGAREERQ